MFSSIIRLNFQTEKLNFKFIHDMYVRKSGQQNREVIGVLYKFRLTTDERSVAIDREEIASVVAGRNDVANVKEVHFRRVSACDARKKSWNATAPLVARNKIAPQQNDWLLVC